MTHFSIVDISCELLDVTDIIDDLKDYFVLIELLTLENFKIDQRASFIIHLYRAEVRKKLVDLETKLENVMDIFRKETGTFEISLELDRNSLENNFTD